MRRRLLFPLVGVILALGLSPSRAAAAPAKEPAACGNHGTSVEFVDSPSEAARRAKQEQKLVFVLHVSGHFEDPRFT
jgi:hypothetical protein